MSNAKYYLAIDNGTQWFSAAFRFIENECVERVNLDSHIRGDFFDNILSREIHFYNTFILDNHWRGWSISEKEFNKIKRLMQLKPLVEEYNKLLEYE